MQSIHNLQALLDEDSDISFHTRLNGDKEDENEDGNMDMSWLLIMFTSHLKKIKGWK